MEVVSTKCECVYGVCICCLGGYCTMCALQCSVQLGEQAMAAMLCGEAGRDHGDDGLCSGSLCPPQLPPSPASLQVCATPHSHAHHIVTGRSPKLSSLPGWKPRGLSDEDPALEEEVLRLVLHV